MMCGEAVAMNQNPYLSPESPSEKPIRAELVPPRTPRQPMTAFGIAFLSVLLTVIAVIALLALAEVVHQ
jgi:hypothetical protein